MKPLVLLSAITRTTAQVVHLYLAAWSSEGICEDGLPSKEMNVDFSKHPRRVLAALGAGIATVALLAACGTGPTGGPSADGASYWYLTGQPAEAVRAGSVERFNTDHPDTPITGTSFANEVYSSKLRTAMGAGEGPTLIFGWGGGGLREFAEAGQVADLTDFVEENPELKERFFESTWGAATVDDKIYAIPGETTSTVVLYFNKAVFEEAGVEPPETWDDVLDLVEVFKAKGIAPFALAGQSRWTEMMYVEYMVDRIGGPQIFQNVLDGKPDAWSDPAVLDALTKLQDLVKAGGFVDGFSSIAPDSGADLALLYTGKAAMLVQGTWTYGSFVEDGGDFVQNGDLGFTTFPIVEGGKGDPSMIVGQPAQYLSISADATEEERETAESFILDNWLDEEETEGWVGTGQVPVRSGSQELLAESDNADFLTFLYETASEAKPLQQHWDQALPASDTEAMLDNISKLFQLAITPQEWVDNMNATIGR